MIPGRRDDHIGANYGFTAAASYGAGPDGHHRTGHHRTGHHRTGHHRFTATGRAQGPLRLLLPDFARSSKPPGPSRLRDLLRLISGP